jgi:hypothetical protein
MYVDGGKASLYNEKDKKSLETIVVMKLSD